MMSDFVDYFVFTMIGIFVLITFAFPSLRKACFSRSKGEWLLDGLSLFNHFVIVPIIQMSVLLKGYEYFFYDYKESFEGGFFISLFLVMLVDYAWYWNHRVLHSRTKLWNFHMVHHGAKHLDVLATARNSFWSPILMVYMWLFLIIVFLLKDPTWFLVFSSLSLLVNFWGHTSFNLKRAGLVYRFLSLFLIMPSDHFWHHSTENSYCNFGTVFNFWDKLHKTWYSPKNLPSKLGFPTNISTLREAFWPFAD